jgi:DNA-binding response OmpR family regulator
MHALIIKDSYLIATSIAEELRDLGFSSFDLAGGYQDAVAAADKRRPDLIVADARLQNGSSGVAAVQTICAQKFIPAFFIVGAASDVTDILPGAIVVLKPHCGEALKDGVREALQSVSRCVYAQSPRDAAITISAGMSD